VSALGKDVKADPRVSPNGSRETFPDGFVWGAATSAFQIEGAADRDGRGESIWDRFCRTPGKVEGGATGDVACDHYNRWREDIALMKDLGLKAYRFSISWPRVMPEGRGRVNPQGLDFYSRLVDGLLEAGITPYATLFHWDLPQLLQDCGGWPRRETAEAFKGYVEAVARRLGDRVENWITHNEPWCAGLQSHQIGRHAPGLTDWQAGLAATHHLLLSHGWAVPIVRAHSPGAKVGITLNLTPAEPASPSRADRDACRHFDGYFNRWFLDPLYGRGYPADMIADYASDARLPEDWDRLVAPGDLATISEPTDFLGVNYYNRTVVRSEVPEAENMPRTVFLAPETDWTDMGWEVHPDGLYQILCRLHFDYRPGPMYVTENGASWSDGPDQAGRVPDRRRICFFKEHFRSARRAMKAGVPLRGYFVWSLMDNFEWERGYAQRFGIVWVDYKTQTRTLKDSARWYQRVIESNSAEVE
jgi:beta-glucosidase